MKCQGSTLSTSVRLQVGRLWHKQGLPGGAGTS